MNQYLNQRLHPFINYYQDNWSKVIPAINTAQIGLLSKSTGLQPYKVLIEFSMLIYYNWEVRTQDLKDLPIKEQLS